MTLGLIRRLRSLTVDHALLESGESILDVGCGTGGVTIPSKLRVGRTGRAAGIDPSPEMIAFAKKKAIRAELEIDFRIGVIESLSYDDATFDVVTSSLMMHHLPERLRVKGLAEVWRVLKPGGRILIADMVHLSPTFWGHISALILHHGHSIEFGIEDLPALLRGAGFEKFQQLEDGFLIIGFVRGTKPAA